MIPRLIQQEFPTAKVTFHLHSKEEFEFALVGHLEFRGDLGFEPIDQQDGPGNDQNVINKDGQN